MLERDILIERLNMTHDVVVKFLFAPLWSDNLYIIRCWCAHI
jgi:hypothetical protein